MSGGLLELPHGIQEYYDYEQALACAKKQNKPLFIDFTGHGCVNCGEMEASVWSDAKVLKEATASAAPEFLGKAKFVNPEEAFAASLGSCHLLTFLAIASFKTYSIKSYKDESMAIVEKNGNGKQAVTKVFLRPKVEFYGDK